MCVIILLLFLLLLCVLHRYINMIILILGYNSYSFDKVLGEFFLLYV